MDDDDTINSQEENYDERIKIMVIGESKIGKTSLISRYCNNQFNGGVYLSTIGIDFQIKNVVFNNKNIRLQIWDTAGQERYKSITSSYYKGSHGCFIVYDITNEKSFENVDNWFKQAQKEASKEVSIILVGNKCDLENERKVSIEMGQNKAKNLNCPFFETSALNNTNIMYTGKGANNGETNRIIFRIYKK